MSGRLIVLRRTSEEKRVFGGEVFIDVDGVNQGKVDDRNLELEVASGKHKIKMYKSHDFGSYIGIAELELETTDAEFVLQYSCPMHVQSPGVIKATLLTDEVDLDSLLVSTEERIAEDRIATEKKKLTILELQKRF